MNIVVKFISVAIVLLCTLNSASAQFGKNKVQYQDFEWKYIKSRHFDVYYHQGLYYTAKFASFKAEDALASISSTLNFKIAKRINIIIYGSHNEFQQTNVVGSFLPEGVGGVTELFKNRVVVPFEGSYEKFRHVIHHELVHAVLNDMFYGGSIQSAIGNNRQMQIPLWMNEGLAEWESNFGYDTPTDMFMRDLTLSESLPPLMRLNGYFAYRGGQAFYHYVNSKYGKGKIGELVARMRNASDLNQAFKSAFGKTVEEFSEEWENAMKKMYFPDLDKYKNVDEFSKRLTNHVKSRNYYNSSPAISADGETIAFISDKEGVFGIYTMKIDGSTPPKEVVASSRTQDFEELNILTPGISWDPSGKKLAISAKAGGEDALFIVNVADNTTEKFTFGLKTITSATWSPDGKWIAFIAVVDGQQDVYRFDTKRKTIDRLTNDVFTEEHITWASNSEDLFFVSDRGDYIRGEYSKDSFEIWNHDLKQNDIYSLNIINQEVTRITFDPTNQKTSLAVSNNMKSLLFVSDVSGIGNLYELNLETKEIKAKSNSLSGITQLSLSKDESKLLFVCQNKGGYDIFMMRNPFDNQNVVDSVPKTKYKINEGEGKKLAKEISSPDSLGKTSGAIEHKGYGAFQIEFSRSTMVPPNKDIPTIASSKLTTDSSDFTPRDYLISFTPDLVQGNAGYANFWGTQGAVQLLFSDLLGNHQIYSQISLLSDLSNSNLYLQYSYLPDIIDYTISGYHNALMFLTGRQAELSDGSIISELVSFRNYGGRIDAQLPLSTFQRVEWGLGFVGVARSNENPDIFLDEGFSKLLMVPSAKYVFDDTQWGYLAPYKGTRAFVDLQGSPKLSNEGIGFVTLRTDIRHYESLSSLYGFMLRFSGGGSFGPDPRKFYIGGTDNWINQTLGNTPYFNDPLDFAFLQFPTPIRGFSIAEQYGTKYFTTNIEFRFPLLQALVAGPIPILFDGVMGSFFMDIGTAWESSDLGVIKFRDPELIPDLNGNTYEYYAEGTLLTSLGMGIRTVVLGLPLRVDIAWRKNPSSWSSPRYMFSLGLDL